MKKDTWILVISLIVIIAGSIAIGYMLAPDVIETIRWRYITQPEKYFASVGYHRYVGAC